MTSPTAGRSLSALRVARGWRMIRPWFRLPRAVRYGVMACVMACMVACCSPAVAAGGDETRPAGGTHRLTPSTGSREPLDLDWLPDGSHLLVGRRWLLSVRDGRFTPWRCAPDSAMPHGDCAARDIAFSPDGARILVLDKASFAIAPRKGSPAVRIQIPRWIKSRPNPANGDLINRAFWLSANTIFVQQFDPATPFEPECGLFDARTRAWRRPRGGCLSSDFGHLFQVRPGPGGWLLLSSSSEGYHALGLVRYDPTTGQSDPGIPPLLLEAPGPINTRFARDGSRVDLISPCVLEGRKPPPCGDDEARSAWKLYSWPTTGGAISVLRSDLPPGSVLDPIGARFAWPEENGICIGDPRQTGTLCIPLPSDRYTSPR